MTLCVVAWLPLVISVMVLKPLCLTLPEESHGRKSVTVFHSCDFFGGDDFIFSSATLAVPEGLWCSHTGHTFSTLYHKMPRERSVCSCVWICDTLRRVGVTSHIDVTRQKPVGCRQDCRVGSGDSAPKEGHLHGDRSTGVCVCGEEVQNGTASQFGH